MVNFCLSLPIILIGVFVIHQTNALSSETFNRYPLSRKALIQKSNEQEFTKRGSYGPIGWSNRNGSVLTPAAIPGVYTADRPFYWNKIDVGCRMTVIQLQTNNDDSSRNSKNDLFIHSPVQLDQALIDALGTLGNVKHVVSPNYEHVKYAASWSDYYPDAYIWGCPGIMEREPDVRWTGEIPFGFRPSMSLNVSEWSLKDKDAIPWELSEIEVLHVDSEHNPFTGNSFFNEVVFFHKPSKTLLVTDTYWNYPGSTVTNQNYSSIRPQEGNNEDFGVWELAPKVEKIPLGSKLWKIGMDKVYRPFYLNFMIKDDKRKSFESEIISQMISNWEVETMIPAHGDIVRGRSVIKNILDAHFHL